MVRIFISDDLDGRVQGDYVSSGKKKLASIDASQLPPHFDSQKAEVEWDRRWSESSIYHYDSAQSRERTFVIDTPPPTVSGSLHVGHVFSYTQADLIVRYKRMRGLNIFYPMGWDDNGLPTERRVQKYFNVRCDPHVPYEPGLKLAPSDKDGKEPAKLVSRQNFIELCLELTGEDEKAFKALWQRTGLSVDWRQEYSTIDEVSRTIAQRSFIDLYEKGHIYNLDAPTMWDVDFQTAVAQAEVEDRKQPGAFYHLRFAVEGGDSFVIATTRPELLPACVGVAAHPEDSRYRSLFGKKAVTPLFRVPVPIFQSDVVDPEKGTGILMVCTFGDATDVDWWREKKLPLRQILGWNGRLLPIKFGSEGWESREPDAANRFYEQLAGKTVKAAQKAIVELLGSTDAAQGDNGPALAEPPKPIEHSVKFYEKGERPLEFIPTRQWFVRLMDKKERLIEMGDRIKWHPDFMRMRYRNWTENLQFDWCISRQRYFGVAFPLWYRLDQHGNPDRDHPILATADMLPVDPMQAPPAGYDEPQRDQPGGFTGETDVFDTWFTSSMSPQIGSRWGLDPGRHAKLFPADLRPQSHEIIRTWAFYTVVKAMLHEEKIPWTDVVISGWILDPDRKKMSKSKGQALTPMHLLDQYGSDAMRYWSASARLGADTAFDENVIKIGRRLVTKIFNASKFVLSQTAEVAPITRGLDLAFVEKLRGLLQHTTESFEDFEYAAALGETERFFWNNFTDTFLELVKLRARSEDDAEGRGSAAASLRLGLNVLLRLFAPFLPYITEEVWSWVYAGETGVPSIHKAPWPSEADLTQLGGHGDAGVFDAAVACWNQINKRKSEAGVSIGRAVTQLTIAANTSTLEKLRPAEADVMSAARAERHSLVVDDAIADDEFEIREAEFAEKT
ncbi:MAG TPA: valine--tRNA ligase [Blastocatellia bacterium]|nr:valine--tRNA ligase [Blastocatellia bacterium]